MKLLLCKELRLTAAPITYVFLAFALMTLIPGYPILVGGFFITLGIFYTFQMARESNDILYTALLPCKKLGQLALLAYQPVILPEFPDGLAGKDLSLLDIGDIISTLFQIGGDVGRKENGNALLRQPQKNFQQLLA